MSKKENQMIELLDKTDKINLLHLALNGQGLDVTYKYSEVEIYIEYIKALVDKTKEIKTEKSTFQSKAKNIDLSKSFFNKYVTKINTSAKLTYLTEAELLDLINKIKNQELTNKTLTLTDNQYNFIYGKNSTELKDFINSLDLPIIERLPSNTKEAMLILDKVGKDKLFNDIYEISGVFKPLWSEKKEIKFKKKFENDNWKKKQLLHGTTNSSVLQILDSGFKLASQLKKENAQFKYSGSALGNAIYFALPHQISKCTSYTDRPDENQVSYIIVADVYYQDVVETESFSNKFKYTGQNIVHAKSVGAYGRDEITALPEQIEIKYILEISKKG